MIYLDNASTTRPFNDVVDIYKKYVDECFLNPSSIYATKNSILEEKIKTNILKKLDLKNKKIIFLSSATEANNLAILGFLTKKRLEKAHLITSTIEHSSILNTFKMLESIGYQVTYLKPNKEHLIDINELKKAIKPNTIFASFMSLNNETGSIINLNDIYSVLHEKNIILHSDCAQSFCKMKNSHLKNCDMFTISSHKIHGLKSIAALVISNDIVLNPLLYGGNQEYGYRSSTVDIPLIASFYKAIEINLDGFEKSNVIIKRLYKYCVEKISNRDFLELNSNSKNSSPYIINFSFKEPIKASVVLEYLSRKDIYVSTTSACNSKKEIKSYVIHELFNDEYRAHNSMRISFDTNNSIDDIDILFNEIDKCSKEKIWKI